MGPKATVPVCGVCNSQPSKYRCSACPTRYCSVACYKTHKQDSCEASTSAAARAPAPQLGPETSTEQVTTTPAPDAATQAESTHLRSLTSLKWPPEPDASVFTDPLKRDDPKPLRHAELERIATSTALRTLLANPVLPPLLRALDSLPTANARHQALARVLGVDRDSLARPAASAFISRDSPPPLEDLLGAATGSDAPITAGSVGDAAMGSGGRDDWGANGWWLGQGVAKVWVGPEERRLMRLWAGSVVGAIDDKEEGEGAWGEGGLAWEV